MKKILIIAGVILIGLILLSFGFKLVKTLVLDSLIVETPKVTLEQKIDILNQKIDTIGNMLLCGQTKDENGKDVLITCNQVIVQTFNKIK